MRPISVDLAKKKRIGELKFWPYFATAPLLIYAVPVPLSLPVKPGTLTYRKRSSLFSIARGAFVPQRGGYGYEGKNKKN